MAGTRGEARGGAAGPVGLPGPAPRETATPVPVAPFPARPARGRRWTWVAAALALAAGLGAFAWMRAAEPARPAVMTAPVTLGTVEDAVLATGLLKPTGLVAVGAQVSGRITRLAVGLGQPVKAGELIAEIDPAPRQNALRMAEANLAGVRAERQEQEATLAEQRRVLARKQALVARSAAAASDVETAAADVEVTEARIAALDARIDSTQVAIDDARVDLGYARITAPMDGAILAVVAQQGQTVNATQTTPTIVVMGALDVMSVEAAISEADVVHVRPGQEAWFTILGDPETRHPATLASIAPAPASITNDTLLTGKTSDAVSTTSSEAIYYNGLFTVPNPDGQLRTYMTAEVHVVLGRAEDVPVIPTAALGARNPDGTRAVQVQGPEGALETRAVSVGLDDGAQVQVLSGLAVGERVVTGSADGPRAESAGARRMPPPMGL